MYKNERNKRHKLYQLSYEIRDDDELEVLEQTLGNKCLELFRTFLTQQKYQMALDLTRFLSSEYIKVAIQLTEQLHITELVQRLVFKMKIKEHYEELEEQDLQEASA